MKYNDIILFRHRTAQEAPGEEIWEGGRVEAGIRQHQLKFEPLVSVLGHPNVEVTGYGIPLCSEYFLQGRK